MLATVIIFVAQIKLGIVLVRSFVIVRWKLCVNGNGIGVGEDDLKIRVSYYLYC